MKPHFLTGLMVLPLLIACEGPADALTEHGSVQDKIVGATYGHTEGVKCLFDTIEFGEDGIVKTMSTARPDFNYEFRYVIRPSTYEDIVAIIDLYVLKDGVPAAESENWFKLLDNGMLKLNDWTCARLS